MYLLVLQMILLLFCHIFLSYSVTLCTCPYIAQRIKQACVPVMCDCILLESPYILLDPLIINFVVLFGITKRSNTHYYSSCVQCISSSITQVYLPTHFGGRFENKFTRNMLLIRSFYMPIRFSRNINSSLDPTYSQLNSFTGWFLYFRVVVVLVVVELLHLRISAILNFKTSKTFYQAFRDSQTFCSCHFMDFKKLRCVPLYKGNSINHSK